MRTCYSKKEGTLRDQLVKSEREKLELQLKHEQDLVNLRQDNEAKKTAALSTEREIKALKKYAFVGILWAHSVYLQSYSIFKRDSDFDST